MAGTLLLVSALLLGLLTVPAAADEFDLQPKGYFDQLPAGVVNTALPHFGQDIIIGGDYGLGNVIRVEIVSKGEKTEARIFRSPELRISHRRPITMQVLIGNVTGLYVWIDTPPVQGEWSLSVTMVSPDGTRTPIFGKTMKPGVRNWMNVDPNTLLECTISTKTTAIKLNRRVSLSLSPVMYAVYPDFLPQPYRTIFE